MAVTSVFFVLALGAQDEGARNAPDAVQLLCRYPSGALPNAAQVHRAIDQLAASDQGESLPLLQSLVRHESGAVQAHARDAVEIISGRALSDVRLAASAHAPSEDEVDLRIAQYVLDRPGIPTSELGVVAYAELVTAQAIWTTDALGSLTPEKSVSTVDRAEQMELEDHLETAIPLLVDAAMSGDARATHGLMARGIDVDRLALGLSSEFARSRGLPDLHVAPVVQSSDPASVTVLLSRAEHGRSLPRLAAIENLGVLLRAGNLEPVWQRRAHDTLVRASTDIAPVVRRTAESALALVP